MKQFPELLISLINWNKRDIPSSNSVRAKIDDWLQVNHLEKFQCLEVIHNIKSENVEPPCVGVDLTGGSDVSKININASEAWEMVFRAFECACPHLRSQAENIYQNAPKCLMAREDKFPREFTYDLGGTALPFISVHYRGTYSDLLALAHEFGHAVQIHASSGCGMEKRKIPPVVKECCAFLAELFLIAYVRGENVSWVGTLASAWQRDTEVYFGADTDRLYYALQSDHSKYDVRWNYPLARFASVNLLENKEPDLIYALFSDGAKAAFWLPETLGPSSQHVSYEVSTPAMVQAHA